MEFAEIKVGWPWLISSASATVAFVLGSLAAYYGSKWWLMIPFSIVSILLFGMHLLPR
jgi:hypothetical protein